MKIFNKYYNQISGYIFITPAVVLISLFGIFPVFFGFYMSFHKWKVFKGRFLGFENYNRILGDIGSFWVFIFGLLLLIFSYWLWSEFRNKFKSKFLLFCFVIFITILSIFIINISWSKMNALGDDDFLNSIIYIFYYSFFAILSEVGL